jgi:putative DNA methylase
MPVQLNVKSLEHATSIIDVAYPAQKLSIESQFERSGKHGQRLTAVASYWKGRKPLILVRSIILGTLLPTTNDAAADLTIYEYLMGIHDDQFMLRSPKVSTAKLFGFAQENTQFLSLFRFEKDDTGGVAADAKSYFVRGVSQRDKDALRLDYIKSLNYEERVSISKRPEECDFEELYAGVWDKVNAHYSHLGIYARSHDELVEQLGILRYGHRPRVGDTFAGGGSIPFEAARLGCNAIAQDLNPIACMLNWANANIVGAGIEKGVELRSVRSSVDEKIKDIHLKMGVENNAQNDWAKSYLYCTEVTCPETGWKIPISPTWIIFKRDSVCAELKPDYQNKRFDINVITGASDDQMKVAKQGTYQNQCMTYTLDGKTYSTPIKTLRGDHKDDKGKWRNSLRQWDLHDYMPREDDIFRDRLYAIQWYTAKTLDSKQPKTYFAAVTDEDLAREEKVNRLVGEQLADWQEKGWVPDMAIEEGDKTSEPIRTRGWRYWHQLFNPRQLLFFATWRSVIPKEWEAIELVRLSKALNVYSKLCMLNVAYGSAEQVFSNQALNTMLNYSSRSSQYKVKFDVKHDNLRNVEVKNCDASILCEKSDIWVTDPPYADAVHYHEITEYFIAWLRKNPPKEFAEWIWDSRRALAIKGDGDSFRTGMVGAYSNMVKNMPDNGAQCVMFTHQDTSVWSDMVNIFWASGLMVTAAWYLATETTSGLKEGGFVQGTVILMLKKRPAGEKQGFRQRIMPQIKNAVKKQVETMMRLNDDVKSNTGAPVFSDADLQMAGYAAALNVLTCYTHVDGQDMTKLSAQPKREKSVVDVIVAQAAETANNLLTPEGIKPELWAQLNGIQRFYLRMLDIETTGANKLSNYENFAKAFGVSDYHKVMASVKQNGARLMQPNEFKSRDLSDSGEIGPTWLGAVIVGIQQTLKEMDSKAVLGNMIESVGSSEYFHAWEKLEAIARYLSEKCDKIEVRDAAEILANQIKSKQAF